jgi:hypothetical protein
MRPQPVAGGITGGRLWPAPVVLAALCLAILHLPPHMTLGQAQADSSGASLQPKNDSHDTIGGRLLNLMGGFELRPQTPLASLIYDDYYIRNLLDERYPYLKLPNGSYLGIRDYFHFEQVFWPSEEYLASKNIEQTLYEEQRALETTASQASLDTWHYSDQDELERSGGPLKDPVKCRQAMQSLAAELELASANPDRLFEPGHRNMELLRWIDSWARPVSETYLGDSFWVGSYRGCRAVELDLNVTTGVGGQDSSSSRKSNGQTTLTTGFNYCWAKLVHRDWPQDDEMRPKMSIRAGICLPDSCDTIEARKMLPTILSIMRYNFSPMHKQRFTRILDVYCLPNEREPGQPVTETGRRFSTGARWFLAALGLWLAAIAAISVWYHWHYQEEQARAQVSWWRMMAVQENYRVFAADDSPPAGSRLDLRALGLVKLLAALMVVLGHSFVQNYYSFHATQVLIRKNREYGYHAFAMMWKSVEMFYVISGILTAYSILTRFAPTNKMHLIIKPRVYLFLNLIRYLRVAPLFMFAWAFVKTTYMDLAEGPYWDYGTNKYTFMGRCKRISWWRSLIWPIILDFKGYTGDPYQHECMSISWYIVTDLKMFTVVPFYLYLAHKFPKLRWPLLLVSLAVSTAWRWAHLSLQQLIYLRQTFTYGEMHAIHIIISFLDSSYYSPVDRFQAVALGLTGGLYLYEYKMGRLKQWPWWMRGKAIGCMLAWWLYDIARRPLEELNFRNTGYIPSEQYLMAWMVLRPRMDAIITTILVLRLCTDWAPKVMRHSAVFYKLSKLSFGVYVIHMLPILYGVMSHERAKPDTIPLQLAMLSVFAIVVSFAISFPMYLLVESPITLLVDYFILGQRKVSKLVAQKRLSRSSSSSSPSPGQPGGANHNRQQQVDGSSSTSDYNGESPVGERSDKAHKSKIS